MMGVRRNMGSNVKKLDVKPQSIELFTGAGGLALATHLEGFHHRGLFEWNAEACQTLRANAADNAVVGLSKWNGKVHEGDVSSVSFSEFEGVDLVAGGPPCQPFSLGGKHKGMEDRRDMIPQFIRAVREARPRAFVMENVRGLTRAAFSTYLEHSKLQLQYPEITPRVGEAWQDHLSRLQQHHTSSPRQDGLAYNVLSSVLNAADFGVPQCRERLFVVGIRSDIDAHWSFPEPTHSQDRLLYDQWVSGKYWGARERRTDAPKRLSARIERLKTGREPELQAWRTIRDAIAGLPKPFARVDNSRTVFNHRLQLGARPYPGHTGSPIHGPSKTLKAGDHGVPGGENMVVYESGACRYLTVREAARVQTFPDAWHFKGAWSEAMRQLGNAVPVDLARAVVASIAQKLTSSSSK